MLCPDTHKHAHTMRPAFAPLKFFTFFALSQCFSIQQSVSPYELAGEYSLRAAVKDNSSQEGTRDRFSHSIVETKKFPSISASLKLHRIPQNRLVTPADTNMNVALEFPLPIVDESALSPYRRAKKSRERRGRRRRLGIRHLSGRRHFEDSLVASVSGEEHVFVPVVHDKYAKAAQLINEYVARDSFLFDDPNRPCPQANWMRVEGRTGRCFKSFDFSEFRSSDPSSEGRAASKSYGTWEEAEHVCMGFGSHLAALHTGAETRFAHMVLDRRPDACWIGLRRAQPQGRRRHEDPSNGWKWITSNQGILEDSDPVEWTRDWQPVWDSISYGPHLCGVFTRKGIAARRCQPINSSRPGGEGRWRRNTTMEGGKKHPIGLSCFLCATIAPGSRLSVNSFARAAEEGNLDWQTGDDISNDSFQDYLHESSSFKSGSTRLKDERKVPRESRNGKNNWILRPQDRHTKRESRNNSNRAEALEGQGYYPYETRGDSHRIHMMRGDHSGDRGRLRREDPPHKSAYYVGLPTRVDGSLPKPLSAGFENDFEGPPASDVQKDLKLKHLTYNSNGEDAPDRRKHSSVQYLTGFESSSESEKEQGGVGTSSDGGRDDLKAETAWLARTSASMRDEKTYSEFLSRFMERQRKIQLQRREEESHNGDASVTTAEKEREKESLNDNPQQPSHFFGDSDGASADGRISQESREEQNGSENGLALLPVEQMTSDGVQAVRFSSAVDFQLASEGQNISEFLESSKEFVKEDTLNYLEENRTAHNRHERKKQRHLLLAILCSCGVGAALAFAGLVFVCVRCRVSNSPSEDEFSSDEEKEPTPEIGGTATNYPLGGATNSTEGASTEEESSVALYSLNSPPSLNGISKNSSVELRHSNIRTRVAAIREQVCTLPNSTVSTEAARTAATAVEIRPTISFCATSQQGVLTTPFECQPLQNTRQNQSHTYGKAYHCSTPGAEDCRTSAPNCSSTSLGDSKCVSGQEWTWKATADKEDKRILPSTCRLQSIRGDKDVQNGEPGLERQKQCDSAFGEEQCISGVPAGENYSRACLSKRGFRLRPKMKSSSFRARSFGSFQTFSDGGLQLNSAQSEAPSAESSEAAVSHVSWKEHQTAGFHRIGEDMPGDDARAEERCSSGRAGKATGNISTDMAYPDEDKPCSTLENKPTLTAMKRILELHPKVGAR